MWVISRRVDLVVVAGAVAQVLVYGYVLVWSHYSLVSHRHMAVSQPLLHQLEG